MTEKLKILLLKRNINKNLMTFFLKSGKEKNKVKKEKNKKSHSNEINGKMM